MSSPRLQSEYFSLTDKDIVSQNLGPFRVKKQLGEGVYSRVYLTEHKETKFPMVIKVMEKNQVDQVAKRDYPHENA